MRDVRAPQQLALGLLLLAEQVPEALARTRSLIKRTTAPKRQGLLGQPYARAWWSSKTFEPYSCNRGLAVVLSPTKAIFATNDSMASTRRVLINRQDRSASPSCGESWADCFDRINHDPGTGQRPDPEATGPWAAPPIARTHRWGSRRADTNIRRYGANAASFR